LIEKLILQHNQTECPVIHSFGPGIYIREVTFFKGIFVIGHRQKKEHLNIMLSGKIAMIDEKTLQVNEITAPLRFVGKPGRKMGYVIETCTWLNVYSTDETDIEKLEEMFLDKSDDWKENNREIERLSAIITQSDRDDFQLFLNEVKRTDEEYSLNYAKFKEIDGYVQTIRDSAIHGKGVFSSLKIKENEIICPVSIDGKLTQFGRYVNHSIYPSCRLKKVGDNVFLKSNCEIPGCIGSTKGTELTINYRF